jgi:hypothetical protein
LDIDLGISPLCLQIYFCINTSFGTPSGTNRYDQYVQSCDRFGEHHRSIGRRSERRLEAGYGEGYRRIQAALPEIIQHKQEWTSHPEARFVVASAGYL